MYLLNDLLKGIYIKKRIGYKPKYISCISFDSRKNQKNSVFVALQGSQIDGHHFIEEAVQTGSIAIVCHQQPIYLYDHVTYICVEDTAQTLGKLAANYYHHPSSRLKLIAVTGTNGKTTTVHLLFNLFRKLGYRVGMISTMYNQIEEQILPAVNTTPNALAIHHLLAQMVTVNCTYCFMEASSHALSQQRLAGLSIFGAVFLNITHDHLDYHIDFQNYIKAKKKLFDLLSHQSFALYNADDKNGVVMIQNTQACKYSFALRSPAVFTVQFLEATFEGILLKITQQSVWFRLLGKFNSYNILAAYSIANILEQDSYEVLRILSSLAPIHGRCELISENYHGIKAIVDYAHTPDALQNVLSSINQIKYKKKIITVVGCGGNRDIEKRPLIGKIADKLSDQVIFTTDNPRYEDPEKIIQDMKSLLTIQQKSNAITILDRREAIKKACLLAQEQDVVLVAGKGHETYQYIQGKKYHFSDVAELKAVLHE